MADSPADAEPGDSPAPAPPPDESLRLRDLREDERPAVRALTLLAYEEYAAVMAPRAWAGLRAAVETALATRGGGRAEQIVAERAGRIAGSVMLFPADSTAYGHYIGAVPAPEVRLLAVDPAERGRGVAQALVEECARRARLAGATELGLHSSDSMRAAIRLYQRMGFVRAPEHDFRPDGAELVQGFRLPLA